jgi:hypothetical protein
MQVRLAFGGREAEWRGLRERERERERERV